MNIHQHPNSVTKKNRHSAERECNRYDFGWNPKIPRFFLTGSVACLLIGAGLYLLFPRIFIVSVILVLLGINLFLGSRTVLKIEDFKYGNEPLLKLFKTGKELVLDAGCGSGRTTIALSKAIGRQCRVIGLDKFDASYIEGGGKTLYERNAEIAGIGDQIQAIKGDVLRMDFEDGKFDAAVSSFMMDHLGKDRVRALKEINRVLKPKGKFLLVVMVPGFFTFSISNFLCLVFLPRSRWRKLFQKYNFKLLDEGNFSGAAYFLAEKA